MISGNQAKRQIEEDDQTLVALLKETGTLILAMSVVHMTGSLEILDEVDRPKPPTFVGDHSGSLSIRDQAHVRRRARSAIKAWRDAGYPPPYRPAQHELHRMINFITGVDLPADYVPMIVEDMALDSEDARAFAWNRSIGEAERQFPAIVIGAGMSGMIMGLRLKQAGIPFTIYEKNESVGGTWFENQYLGLRVDVPSHAYSFSFTQDHRWSHLYSFQPELIAYFRQCVDRFGIAQNICYGVEVAGADYDPEVARWTVSLRHADGRTETKSASTVVSAVGLLNRPQVPEFPGMADFKGVSFHTARWRHDVPLEEKRIIVVGNAATGVQTIPELARIAGKLTVFQRSAGWSFINPEYDRRITQAEQWAIDHLPFYSAWLRVSASNWGFDLDPVHMKIDPAWPQSRESVSAANEQARIGMIKAMEEILQDRPDVLAKVIPDYPPFVKRPTVSNGNFFRALRQDNVELVTDGIDRIVADGIIDRTGRLHAADVIIFATGFQPQKFLAPMVVRGRSGKTLNEYWADHPGGYLGMTVPEFPNFFMMYGPGTNLGYNGNLIFNSELQARYIAHCLRHLIENGFSAIEVRKERFDDYMAATRAKLAEFVWSSPYGTNYFRNEAGIVTTNSPWSLLQHWDRTREVNPDDFILS